MRYESHSFFPMRWWSCRKLSRQRVPQRSRSVRLRLEQLEDRIMPTGPTLTAVASFNGTNGASPYAGLIMDGSGNLFGTTTAGGASHDGTVFELAKGSGTIHTLVSFNGSNGAGPYAGLILDGSGNLYGTTTAGGAVGDGTVFELANGSNTIQTLA